MGPNIYKPGQGYWTRTMSAIGFGLVALMGGMWLWDQLSSVHIEGVQTVFVQAGAMAVVLLLCGVLIYYYIGKKRRTVDFMIATEGEMKKVNWSTRREIVGMTWVVIGLTFFIAAWIFVLDYGLFSRLMQWIGVLETAE